MFAMSILSNTFTFALTALFYSFGYNLMCDFSSHVWVALKDKLVPEAVPVEEVTTVESTSPRTSQQFHSVATPISTPELNDTLPRLPRPRKTRGKFSYTREREERERRQREKRDALRPLLPPILSVSLERYPGNIKDVGPFVLCQSSLAVAPSKLVQTTTVSPSGEFVDKSFVEPKNPATSSAPSAQVQTTTPTLIRPESDDLSVDSNLPTPTSPPAPVSEPVSEPAPTTDTTPESAASIADVTEATEPTTATSEPTPVPAESTPAAVEPTSPSPTEPAPTEPVIMTEPSVPVAGLQAPPEHTPVPVPNSTGPILLPADAPPSTPSQPTPSVPTQQTPTAAIPGTTSAPAEEALPIPTPAPPAPAETSTAAPLAPESAHSAPLDTPYTTPAAPTISTPPTPGPNTQTTAVVPARAPNEAARPDSTVTDTTQGSIGSLVRLVGQMSIHELVEHEMEDWTGVFEMDVDEGPTVDAVVEMVKELELAMWDSIEEMERWRSGKGDPSTWAIDIRDTPMTSPYPDPISPEIPALPMVLDVHDNMDTPAYSCVDTDMDTDSAWTDSAREMDWTFGVPNPWLGPTLLAAPVTVWNSDGHTPDVHMEEGHMSPVAESEGGQMEEVVEDGPAEVVTTQQPSMDAYQVVEHLAWPIETEVENELEHAEDVADVPTDEVPANDTQDAIEEPATPEEPQEAVEELVEELAAMWTPADAEAAPEDDFDSDGEGAEDGGGIEDETEEDVEADLDALEEEHFQASAEDFLAGLGAELMGAQV
ncbi:unnamed protein product [Rhizoctonia solani]|uniref:Uncharacterized protein n=1 Tax=Rhizoctonia solani TaxID=456999 RepID=A0A8H2XJK7_9AGAM|nr:unnamed protein product [Rhizoctonia solani]